MTPGAELVRGARRYRNVSGRQLAREAKASQAALVSLEGGDADATSERLDRLLKVLGFQLAVLPTRRGTAAAAAGEVGEYLTEGDEHGAQRVVWQLAEDLDEVDGALAVALCVTPPSTTGDGRFDALIAGVVDHLLTTAGLPRPTWLDEPWRTLKEPWDVEPVPALRDRARRATPPALLAHGVHLDPRELVNA